MKNVVNYILSAQKKIFVVAFLAVFSSFYTMVWGASHPSGSTTVTVSGSTITISGEGAMANYANGSEINSLWGTAISSATTLIVEDGVTHIGAYSFYGFKNLTSVTIPSSVTSIGAQAFNGCSALKKLYYAGTPSEWASINFGDQNANPFCALTVGTGKLHMYGKRTAKSDSILVLSPTIKEIKPYAFYKANIAELSIPGTVERIGDYAFYCKITGNVAINRRDKPTTGTFSITFDSSKTTYLYIPAGASSYSSNPWYDASGTNGAKNIGRSSDHTACTVTESGTKKCKTSGSCGANMTWTLTEDGTLTFTGHGAMTNYENASDGSKSTVVPWCRLRRLIYKVVVQGDKDGDITGFGNNTFNYMWGINEVELRQTTILPASFSFSSIFNQRDKLTLTITDPASRLDASWSRLDEAPWNDDDHWEIVYPTTTVTLSKDAETNGTFILSSSSLNTTSSAQTVSVTCTPSEGYATSSVSATNPDILLGDITYAGSDNERTVTYPAHTHGSSTISVEFVCARPTISTDLSTEEVEYEQNAAASALSVTADANSGDLSYQWQSSSDNSSWSDIDGADEASFTPPTTEIGTTFYHCIVTNTTDDCDESETSNAAQITVTAPSPSAWSLHYGTDGQSDWTIVDFSRVESTTEWQIKDFVIPNKPNWYVDNAAGNDPKKKLSTWGDLYFAASQQSGTCPMVGAATGAIGTVRIYDNSNWNNRYAGFIPNGYVLKIGSNEYSFASEDGNEYRSEIIEYSGSNARDNVSVGIVDENGAFVSTDNTSEMQHIFLHVGNNTTLWGKDGVTNFGLYDDTEGHKYFTCLMTAVPGENYLYEGWVPSNCTKVIFCRLKSSTLDWGTGNDNVYNLTNSLVLQDNQNLWTVTGWGGGDGNWSAYTQKGRFCIWQSSIVKNWGVCFRPCYEFNNTAGDGNWNTAGNWKPQSVPTIDFDVFLNKPVTVNVTTAQAKSVVINQTTGNSGQLVVDAGQKLIVAGTIQKTTDGETYSATEANDIIINSDATHGLGALVMGTHDGTNQATVNFTTLSSGTSDDNTSVAQYVGTPFNDETNILHNWYNSWVYGIDHTEGIIGWERVNEGQGMAPFKGYCIFSADGTHHNYWQQGTLVASENQTISGLNWQSGVGTANLNNENLLANSWMAPIKISTMETSDFTNTEATIYIFNSTSASDYEKGGFASNYTGYTPGTAGDAIIPSMQSFSVFTKAAGGSSVALDYNKIVYQPALSGTVPGPNHAPRRAQAESEEANKLRLFVRTESGYGDLLYMWERSDFSEAFENGWDGHKLFGESVAPQLFALSPDGDLAINCIPTFEGVQMGFKAGEQDNSYTFTFEYSDEAQPLYLLDISTNTYTQITSDTSYSFTTTDTDVHNRFVLTYNAPSTPTALETTPVVTTGKKVIYDNHLFILHNGRIFSAQGAMIQ